MLEILLFLHLIGLVIGIGIPITGLVLDRIAASSSPELAASLRSIRPKLMPYSQAGLVTLVVTGLLMLALSSQARAMVTFAGAWFWLKMLAVAGLAAVVVFMFLTVREAQAGNPAVMARMRFLGPAALGLGLLATLFAVFGFN